MSMDEDDCEDPRMDSPDDPRIDSLDPDAFASSSDVLPAFVFEPPICSRRRWWLAMPPLRPASRASSLVHSCAVPFWWAALPPLLAISRCFKRSIEANPRSSLATLSSCHNHLRDPLPFAAPGPHVPSGRLQRRCHGS